MVEPETTKPFARESITDTGVANSHQNEIGGAGEIRTLVQNVCRQTSTCVGKNYRQPVQVPSRRLRTDPSV